ncbi:MULTISPECIES: hypothetical protein [Streptomyces]|uniref:hypothetical protein n=1 Tax=Streptomyces TaxID=1883 RepID=UPI001C249760|nr:hypothetical protein [Streptomyces sp. AC558_RSS880]
MVELPATAWIVYFKVEPLMTQAMKQSCARVALELVIGTDDADRRRFTMDDRATLIGPTVGW